MSHLIFKVETANSQPLYDRICPTMHSGCSSPSILKYALDRLPQALFEFSTIRIVDADGVFPKTEGSTVQIMSKNEPRLMIAKTSESECVLVLRDSTIDLYDFVSMLCQLKKELANFTADKDREAFFSFCKRTGCSSNDSPFPVIFRAKSKSSSLSSLFETCNNILLQWIQQIKASIASMCNSPEGLQNSKIHLLISSKRVVTNALGIHNSVKFANVCTVMVTAKYGLYKALVVHWNKIKHAVLESDEQIFLVVIPHMFGAQSRTAVKFIGEQFGRAVASINIVGKCGGLVGKRGDIIICEKILADDYNQTGQPFIDLREMGLASKTWNQDLVRKMSSEFNTTDVHSGLILSVRGTLLQNETQLRRVKKTFGAIGLEMESYHLALSISECKLAGLFNYDVVMRAAYYISDLPLDPNQNLDREYEITNYKGIVYPMIVITQSILRDIRLNQ